MAQGKHFVLAGDFILFFGSNLEAVGDKPVLKEKSLVIMVELKEEYDLCNIWRIRNPLEKSFTFQQNQSSGILNCKLDYIFISSKLQEFSNKAIIFPAFKTDHSSVSVIISNYDEVKPGAALWKFNNSLISDENFTEKLEKSLSKT